MSSFTLEVLKNHAIRLYDGMIIETPQSQEEILTISKLIPIEEFNDCYAVANSIICFIINDEVFVAPSTNFVWQVVNGLQEKCFFVPFSDGACPKREKVRWHALCAKANSIRRMEFAEKCKKFCSEHGISGISQSSVLDKCVKIPENGVKIKIGSKIVKYTPLMSHNGLWEKQKRYFGNYGYCGSYVIFANNDGKTYIGRACDTVIELWNAGYAGVEFSIPIENSEQILDSDFKEQWVEKIGN